MSDPDNSTGAEDPYTLYVDDFTSFYNSQEPTQAKFFAGLLGKKSRILDVGSVSGRDLKLFLDAGLDAYGMEPADAMRSHAEQSYPTCRNRIFEGSLPDLPVKSLIVPFEGQSSNLLPKGAGARDGSVNP